MTASVFIAGFIMGALAVLFACVLYLWENFMDHGGVIMLKPDCKGFKIYLNEEDIDDLRSDKYVILKVSTYEDKLNLIESEGESDEG